MLNIISGTLSTGAPPVSPTSYESIATVTAGSGGAASLTFSSIPQTYKHLQIRGIVRSDRSGNAAETMKYQFNSDTSLTTSSVHAMTTQGNSVTSGGAANYFTYISEYIPAPYISTNTFAGIITDILDYTDTNKNKVVKTMVGFDNNGGGYNGYLQFVSDSWMNTSAISSITITSNTSAYMSQYSSFALYGIKG